MFTCLKLIPLSGFLALQVRYSQCHYRGLQIFLFQFDDSRTGLLFGFFFFPLNTGLGNFLAVQWLRLCASTAEAEGSIPSQGSKICS